MTALSIVSTQALPQPSFGLHKLDDIWYLFQDTMNEGVAIVLKDQQWEHQSGRNTELAGIGGACTHNINPFLIHRRIPKCQWGNFVELAQDPLVELFLPVPLAAKRFNTKIFLLDTTFNPSWFFLIKNLERLSSPLHSKVDPWLSEFQHKRISDLQLSNLQPLVYSLTMPELNTITQKHVVEFSEAIAASDVNRPVLLMANTQVISGLRRLLGEQATQIKTGLTDRSLVTNIMHYPFEHMGSRVMGHYCITGKLQVS